MENMNLSLPVNPIQLLDQLVKANPALFEQMDKDKTLTDQYNKDSKKFEELQGTIDNLLAYMVDQTSGSKSDLGQDRLIPNQRIPVYYLRRAGASDAPLMVKSLRRNQFTSYGVPASRKQFGKEVGSGICIRQSAASNEQKRKKKNLSNGRYD